MDCQELTKQITNIKDQMTRFDSLIDDKNPNEAIKIKDELRSLFETELAEYIWPFETLTKKEIEKQLVEWQTIYKELELTNIDLPSKEALLMYLSDNPEFIALMKYKEKQGFTQMVIAPLAMKNIIDQLDAKVIAQGGQEKHLSDMWKDILKDEKQTRYFGTVEGDVAKGGYTLDQISANPGDFGLLEGCLISFVKPRQNIIEKDEPDETDATGRVEIKGGKKAQEYHDSYFSGKDLHYQGEQALVPQEWLALFAQDFYKNYLENNRKIGTTATDLFDAGTTTWFTSTAIPGRASLPCAFWASGSQRLAFNDLRPADSVDNLAPRPSVRKPLKI